MCLYLGAGSYAVKAKLFFVDFYSIFQCRSKIIQLQINQDTDRGMMTAECNEQREERVFRKDKGKCAFSTNTGSLFQRYTFCSYFYSCLLYTSDAADEL